MTWFISRAHIKITEYATCNFENAKTSMRWSITITTQVVIVSIQFCNNLTAFDLLVYYRVFRGSLLSKKDQQLDFYLFRVKIMRIPFEKFTFLFGIISNWSVNLLWVSPSLYLIIIMTVKLCSNITGSSNQLHTYTACYSNKHLYEPIILWETFVLFVRRATIHSRACGWQVPITSVFHLLETQKYSNFVRVGLRLSFDMINNWRE